MCKRFTLSGDAKQGKQQRHEVGTSPEALHLSTAEVIACLLSCRCTRSVPGKHGPDAGQASGRGPASCDQPGGTEMAPSRSQCRAPGKVPRISRGYTASLTHNVTGATFPACGPCREAAAKRRLQLLRQNDLTAYLQASCALRTTRGIMLAPFAHSAWRLVLRSPADRCCCACRRCPQQRTHMSTSCWPRQTNACSRCSIA